MAGTGQIPAAAMQAMPEEHAHDSPPAPMHRGMEKQGKTCYNKNQTCLAKAADANQKGGWGKSPGAMQGECCWNGRRENASHI